MRSTLLFSLLTFVALFSGAGQAAADIVSVSASNLRTGQMESDTSIFLVRERAITLGADLMVDGTPGDPMGSVAGGMVPQGRHVQSWLLHSDKIGVTQDRVDVAGIFDFGAPILGLVFDEASLDVTDPIFGDPGIEYPTGAFLPVNGRYYRGTGPEDTRAVVADVWELMSPSTLKINMQTNSVGIDQMRVITAIPEPGSMIILTTGLWGWLVARRRRRHPAGH